MQQGITIEESVALDDSCQLQFWAKGHHSQADFVKAVEQYIKDEGRDIPSSSVKKALIKSIYQRVVPCRGNDVSDSRFVHQETAERGNYPIMLMDSWFPLHAYKD